MNFDARNAKMNSLQRDKLSDAIVRAGRGDRKAFETLYMATAAGLLDVCLRIFPDGAVSRMRTRLSTMYVGL
jgi:allantoicase